MCLRRGKNVIRINSMLENLELVIPVSPGNSRYVICGYTAEFMLEMEGCDFRGNGRKWY